MVACVSPTAAAGRAVERLERSAARGKTVILSPTRRLAGDVLMGQDGAQRDAEADDPAGGDDAHEAALDPCAPGPARRDHALRLLWPLGGRLSALALAHR